MTYPREQAKQYLANHRIPQMFEGLLSCLMLERPDNPIAYLEQKMGMVKEIGLDKVNWETFVYHIHPYRDETRCQYIRDGSAFDKQYQMDQDMKRENSSQNCNNSGSFKPDVFQLTEAQS